MFQKVGRLFEENMSFNSGENSEAELPVPAGPEESSARGTLAKRFNSLRMLPEAFLAE